VTALRAIPLWMMSIAFAVLSVAADDGWLQWDARRAEAIGKSTYVQGRVGRLFDTRLLKTERAYNYKLAATWFTPDVTRASARVIQLAERLTDDSARKLVSEIEVQDQTLVMVEIDPREGSGVIPTEWSAFLAPVTNGAVGTPVRGTQKTALRSARAASGVFRRNYDYDRFWITFPLVHEDGSPLFPTGATEAELVVRIHDREGTVRWKLPRDTTSAH